MNTGRREETILVIDSDRTSLTEFQSVLSFEFTRVETATCLAEAEAAMAGRSVELVVCDINAGCIAANVFDSTQISSWAAEILLMSPGQQADVAFREVSGRLCFCLSKQACPDLLLLIAKQALRRCSKAMPKPAHIKRPTISLTSLNYPSVASNIHSLY